ncbi:MAG TPA: winged helix-turn-helix domain-containing protein [Pseudonocardiaceae bacterium]|nr:winged helix-turn-helix domain-containing protein [Pseudonocardiaceae bacterium]
MLVHFSVADLARLRLCVAPAPLMESALAFAALRVPQRSPALGSWRQHAQRCFPAAARPLVDVIPAHGPAPEFLDQTAGDLDEAVDLVLSVPPRLVRSDLARCWAGRARQDRRPPAWLRLLGDGDRATLATVTNALRAFHIACVEPFWPEVRARFEHDRDVRVPVLVTGGPAALFESVGLRWRDDAACGSGSGPGERWLDGTGLQVTSSAFYTGPPMFVVRPASIGGNALIYPALPVPDATERAGLAAALGHTRAALLAALDEPCGTTRLAARLGISAASASVHAKALREAGLIRTTRAGCAVRHALTPLGRALLAARPPAAG